jgi:REP element-mobilizing transposase RayT
MPDRKQGSAGVSPAMNGGQDARAPLVVGDPHEINGGQDARPPLVVADPHEKVEVHWHHLPHWQQGEAAHFVTWRLGDSLPREKLEMWKQEKDVWLHVHPEPWDDATRKEYHQRFSDRLEEWLDAGAGACILRNSENRQIVSEALHHFDGQRYVLWVFVIMPNHVHVLFSLRPPHRLEDVLHSWKSYTAKVVNRRLGQSRAVWQEDYWDRLIRSGEHYERCVQYVCDNAVKARLSTEQYTLFESTDTKEGSAGVPPVMNGGQDARPPL